MKDRVRTRALRLYRDLLCEAAVEHYIVRHGGHTLRAEPLVTAARLKLAGDAYARAELERRSRKARELQEQADAQDVSKRVLRFGTVEERGRNR